MIFSGGGGRVKQLAKGLVALDTFGGRRNNCTSPSVDLKRA